VAETPLHYAADRNHARGSSKLELRLPRIAGDVFGYSGYDEHVARPVRPLVYELLDGSVGAVRASRAPEVVKVGTSRFRCLRNWAAGDEQLVSRANAASSASWSGAWSATALRPARLVRLRNDWTGSSGAQGPARLLGVSATNATLGNQPNGSPRSISCDLKPEQIPFRMGESTTILLTRKTHSSRIVAVGVRAPLSEAGFRRDSL